jgi:hypothetical protein
MGFIMKEMFIKKPPQLMQLDKGFTPGGNSHQREPSLSNNNAENKKPKIDSDSNGRRIIPERDREAARIIPTVQERNLNNGRRFPF